MYMEIMTSSFNLRAECNSLLSLKVLLYQYLLSEASRRSIFHVFDICDDS